MILYTSDNSLKWKTVWVYAGVTVFCAIFGVIYEIFSHGVYSVFMMCAFLIPLLLGVIPALIIKKKGLRKPEAISYGTWNAGVATITIGSLFQGVLEIYGTTNRLIWVYPFAGIPLLFIGLISYISYNNIKAKSVNEIIKIEMEYNSNFEKPQIGFADSVATEKINL